jgi:uncharacterized protein (DUF2267 family)
MAKVENAPIGARVDHRQRLEVIRDQLTDAMLEADASVKAQIAGQLRQVLREIAELPATEGKSARDRFTDRVSAANRPASSA